MYKVIINTDSYKLRSCSKKNWEPGAVNDFMIALNGWNTTEPNLLAVKWRLMMFTGNTWPNGEWDESLGGLSLRYQKWLNRKCNKLKYYDRLCEFERVHEICPYGWKQGYLDIEKAILELRKNGVVRILFKAVYDIRQYDKHMDGCYMEIRKC